MTFTLSVTVVNGETKAFIPAEAGTVVVTMPTEISGQVKFTETTPRDELFTELLEAAKAIVEVIIETGEWAYRGDSMQNLEAAIAKAKGGT
jgi:hypothetical protein